MNIKSRDLPQHLRPAKPRPIRRIRVCSARIDPKVISALIVIPGLKLESELNLREHWAARHQRIKKQKHLIGLHLIGKAFPALPVKCTIVREGPRRLDDDNAWGSAKALRDTIAAHYGVDDGGSDIQFDVVQDVAAGKYGVRIVIERTGRP